MQKKSFRLLIALFSIIILIFNSCVNHDETKVNPNYPLTSESTSPGTNLTLPGTNLFAIDSGNVTLISLYSPTIPSANFKAEKGKCDVQNDLYVLTMVSPSANLSYTNLFFLTKPTVSQTYNLVTYEDSALTANNAWLVITIIKDNKSWRAKSGTLNLIVQNGNIIARFDTARVECTSNITDTTYYKMSGSLFCQ